MADVLTITNIGGVAPATALSPHAVGGPGFKQVLLDQIARVDRLQGDAERAVAALATRPSDDVAHVMLAQRRADAAFDALLRVHDTLRQAYEELRQVQV